MICKRCGTDVHHTAMSSTQPGICRRCTYAELPWADGLADWVNGLAMRKYEERCKQQARYAPSHPTEVARD